MALSRPKHGFDSRWGYFSRKPLLFAFRELLPFRLVRNMRTFPVHIISRKALKQFWEKHSDSEISLRAWFKITNQAHWKHISEVRAVFPHADAVGMYTVFNIHGNRYRLITQIDYETGKVFIHSVLTHAAYDREF
jgi:mRNA interferase HigB